MWFTTTPRSDSEWEVVLEQLFISLLNGRCGGIEPRSIHFGFRWRRRKKMGKHCGKNTIIQLLMSRVEQPRPQVGREREKVQVHNLHETRNRLRGSERAGRIVPKIDAMITLKKKWEIAWGIKRFCVEFFSSFYGQINHSVGSTGSRTTSAAMIMNTFLRWTRSRISMAGDVCVLVSNQVSINLRTEIIEIISSKSNINFHASHRRDHIALHASSLDEIETFTHLAWKFNKERKRRSHFHIK